MGNLSAKTLPIVDWASASDIPDLIAVWWDSFNDDFIRRIYPQTPDGRQWLERAFAKNLAPRTDPDIPATEVIIVRDPDTGAYSPPPPLLPMSAPERGKEEVYP